MVFYDLCVQYESGVVQVSQYCRKATERKRKTALNSPPILFHGLMLICLTVVLFAEFILLKAL